MLFARMADLGLLLLFYSIRSVSSNFKILFPEFIVGVCWIKRVAEEDKNHP